MRIVGFCDFDGTSIEEQITTAERLNIDHLLLRKIMDKTINEISNDEIKMINQKMKNAKKDIIAIDSKIAGHCIDDIDAYEQSIIEYEKTFEIANKLKVNNVFYRLPKINNIIEEFDILEGHILPIINLAKKYHITLLIYPENHRSNVLLYILKKINRKELTLIFNPKEAVFNKDSAIVGYRLLKDKFNFFVAADVDKKNNPELLGYGRVKIIEIFKRMNRDNYRGYIILDDSFCEFISENKTKKVPWYKKLFNKDNFTNYLTGYQVRIFPKEPEREINVLDIYENQIKALKIVFNLR